MATIQKPIEGIVVPLITPLTESFELHEEALARLIDYVLQGGVDSLFLLGTTGEGPCLSKKVKTAMIRSASKHLKGRTKNLIGITDTSPQETIRWSYVAADHGADAVVLAPPPYFPYTQKELLAYVRLIIQQSPLPVMLYNIPKLTKTAFDGETIRRLTDEKQIIGFKDSSRDWTYFQQVIEASQHRPDWSILTGAEELLLESMAAGANGGVLGGANLFPRTVCDFYQAIKHNDNDSIARLGTILSDCRRIYGLGTGATSSIQVLKYMLEQKGICSSVMSPPFSAIDEATGRQIQQLIKQSLA